MPEDAKIAEQKKAFREAIKSAKNIGVDMLKAIQGFNASCGDGVYNPNMFGMVHNLYNAHPDLMLLYCTKASTLLIHSEGYFHLNAFSPVNSSMFDAVLNTLLLVGMGFSKFKIFDESLDFLSRASEIGHTSYRSFDDHSPMLPVLAFVENELGHVKFMMGEPDEKTLPHFRKCTDIQERYLDEFNIDYGHNCMDLCLRYVKVCDFKQALPFCLKAVKIFTKHFGINSQDVAAAKRHLDIIRGSLRDHKNADDQHQGPKDPVHEEMGR